MSQKISVRQVKAARALLDWSQSALADASGVSLPTIRRLEAGDGDLKGSATTVDKLTSSLEAAGIEFLLEHTGGTGVRMRPE